MPRFIPLGQEDPMNTLCRMTVNTNYEDLPDKVTNCAKQSILDTIAVMMGGSAMETIPQIVSLIRAKGGKAESHLLFYGGKLPASEVALALGPMARAMDYGQVHEEASHCSEYIVPSLLAATGLKDKVTGKEFITAFTVGQEVLIRIGIALKVLSKALTSGHISGGCYNFGATAAVGKLLNFSQEELENAEGITTSSAMFTSNIAMLPVTHLMRVHHGLICQYAINACQLTKAGIIGPHQDILAPPNGYLSLATWETDPSILTKELGENWEMTENISTKWYTACLCTHAATDGILSQMREHNFDVDDIVTIDVDQCSRNWYITTSPKEIKWHPKTAPECQFSLPYVVAIAAHQKGVFLDAYTPESMARQDVRELMTRITAKEDPSLPQWAARVHTTLRDGRKFSNEAIYIKGGPQNPLTEQELVAKFKKCVPYSASRLSDSAVESVIEAILNLERVDDVVSTILLPLTPK